MRPERLERLADDVWADVAGRLRAEPGWTGADAGRVATAVRRAFEAAVRAIRPGRGAGEALFCEFCGSGPERMVCERGRP
jgi:hypothetical protein